MLLIVRPRSKKRITLGFRILVTMFILTLVIGHLYNMYHDNNVIREGWLRDDKPSGNPIRVYQNKPTSQKNDVDKRDIGTPVRIHKDPKVMNEENQGVIDRFVIKLRDFYLKDQ